MEELQSLVKIIKGLPSLALWVGLGFWAYKVIIIGSIYGVIKFVAGRLFDWLKTQKAREVEYKEIRPMIDGMCIRAQTDRLIAQITRIKGKGINIESDYIHSQSVDWLREAIDDKVQKDLSKQTK